MTPHAGGKLSKKRRSADSDSSSVASASSEEEFIAKTRRGKKGVPPAPPAAPVDAAHDMMAKLIADKKRANAEKAKVAALQDRKDKEANVVLSSGTLEVAAELTGQAMVSSADRAARETFQPVGLVATFNASATSERKSRPLIPWPPLTCSGAPVPGSASSSSSSSSGPGFAPAPPAASAPGGRWELLRSDIVVERAGGLVLSTRLPALLSCETQEPCPADLCQWLVERVVCSDTSRESWLALETLACLLVRDAGLVVAGSPTQDALYEALRAALSARAARPPPVPPPFESGETRRAPPASPPRMPALAWRLSCADVSALLVWCGMLEPCAEGGAVVRASVPDLQPPARSRDKSWASSGCGEARGHVGALLQLVELSALAGALEWGSPAALEDLLVRLLLLTVDPIAVGACLRAHSDALCAVLDAAPGEWVEDGTFVARVLRGVARVVVGADRSVYLAGVEHERADRAVDAVRGLARIANHLPSDSVRCRRLKLCIALAVVRHGTALGLGDAPELCAAASTRHGNGSGHVSAPDLAALDVLPGDASNTAVLQVASGMVSRIKNLLTAHVSISAVQLRACAVALDFVALLLQDVYGKAGEEEAALRDAIFQGLNSAYGKMPKDSPYKALLAFTGRQLKELLQKYKRFLARKDELIDSVDEKGRPTLTDASNGVQSSLDVFLKPKLPTRDCSS
jgi:hypothetical protein